MSQIQISLKPTPKSVLVALGGNLHSTVGPPFVTLNLALANLRLRTNSLMAISKFFVTPCFPAGYGPDYVNAAVKFNFCGEARDLLDTLHEIETMFGRARGFRWGGRVLDLDLLAFGNIIAPNLDDYCKWQHLPLKQQMQKTPTEMILPHPRLQERAFVLGPLMDLAPDWRHPVLRLTVREMFRRLPQADRDALQPLAEP